MTDEPEITPLGAAIVESGLSVRQAHELLKGCTAENPCAECLRDFGEQP